MEIRVAIQVVDDKDRRHLATTLRLANLRDSSTRWLEVPLEEADVVIIRRGEPDSATLLGATRPTGLPVVVVYTMNKSDQHPWVLRWPARTTDLAPLAESLALLLQARRPAAAGMETAGARLAANGKTY